MSTRIFEYACFEPINNMDRINDLLYESNQLRNKLVEIEHSRREQLDKRIMEEFPEIRSIQSEIDKTTSKIEDLQELLKTQRKKLRKRIQSTKASEEIKRLKKIRSDLYSVLKEAKKSADLKSIYDEVGKTATDQVKAAYQGKWWGMYLPVLEGMKKCRQGAPPKFRGYLGEGKIGNQIQGGMSVEELVAGNNTQLQMVIDDPFAKKVKATLLFRIGSDQRKPVWTALRVHFHRPLPADCRIKQSYLIRRKVGTKSKWFIQFVVTNAGSKPCATDGTVGIDVGWRMTDRGLRVAFAVGSDGFEDELILDHSVLQRFQLIEHLQELIDRQFNLAKDRVKWLRQHAPEWLKEATKHYHTWRAPRKLAKVIHQWRQNRFEGDEFIFMLLEGWRKQDKHLFEWMSNERESLIKHRNEIYRRWVKKLSRRYAIVGVEDFDLRDVAKRPDTEDDGEAQQARFQRHIAAISELRKFLGESGMQYIKVNSKGTTKTCNKCERSNNIGSSMTYECKHCGHNCDRDQNGATNVLRASEEKIGCEQLVAA